MDKNIVIRPRHCFLMTQLGTPIPEEVLEIVKKVTEICNLNNYMVIDATEEVTGRDFLGSVDNWFFEAKKERIEEKLVLV
ncbi:MAG: hypothetical protein HKM04_04730 [Legionellales bacterium]|nr:hypothetical protein [Legionellales bacterium]